MPGRPRRRIDNKRKSNNCIVGQYRKQVKPKTLGDGYTSRAAAIALPPFGPNKRCLKLSFFSCMFLRKNETGVMFKHLHAAMYNFLPVASYFSAFSGNETQPCHKLMA